MTFCKVILVLIILALIILGVVGFLMSLIVLNDENELVDISLCHEYMNMHMTSIGLAALCSDTSTNTQLCNQFVNYAATMTSKLSLLLKQHEWSSCPTTPY